MMINRLCQVCKIDLQRKEVEENIIWSQLQQKFQYEHLFWPSKDNN